MKSRCDALGENTGKETARQTSGAKVRLAITTVNAQPIGRVVLGGVGACFASLLHVGVRLTPVFFTLWLNRSTSVSNASVRVTLASSHISMIETLAA